MIRLVPSPLYLAPCNASNITARGMARHPIRTSGLLILSPASFFVFCKSTEKHRPVNPNARPKIIRIPGKKQDLAAAGMLAEIPIFMLTWKEASEVTGIRNGSGMWELTGSSEVQSEMTLI